MTSVRKALAEDFAEIHSLLVEFPHSGIDKEGWRQLFVDHWRCGDGYFGYVLIEENRIVGFLGLIFSRRVIRGEEHRFCNFTSWIVKREHRGKSLFLLLPVLKLRGYTMTDVTPSKEVYGLLKKAGFVDFETHFRLVFPMPKLRWSFSRCSIITDEEDAKKKLNAKCFTIYRDHQEFKCVHVFINTSYGTCYVILGRLVGVSLGRLVGVRRKVPFPYGKIYYISNLDVFRKMINEITLSLCVRLKVFFLYVDERNLKGQKISCSIKMKRLQPKVFRSESLKGDDIGCLYSELVVLNM